MTGKTSRVVSFFIHLFESHLSDLEIKEFILNKLIDLNLHLQKNGNFEKEIIEINENLTCLGWTELSESYPIENNIIENNTNSDIQEWFLNFKNGKVIDCGIIAQGAGANLDWLDESNKDPEGLQTIAIESILKFVEVKRKKTINAFSHDLTRDEKIQEGLRISILFSRASRRHNDLRYLNAALKLNDWYFSICRKAVSKKLLVIFLLALTEQEISVAEMLK